MWLENENLRKKIATSLEKFNFLKGEWSLIKAQQWKFQWDRRKNKRKTKGKEGETVYSVRRYTFTSELLEIIL